VTAAARASGSTGERHLASHVFNVAVLVVGTTVLVWMLDRLGFANVRRVLTGVGAWFAVILALDIAALACEAAAIRQFLRPEARMIAYWRVLAAQASGRAINILTPGGALGEATKISLLVVHAPRDRVVSAIVSLNLAAFYLSVAVVIIGVPITMLFVDLPRDLEVVVWVALAIVSALVIGLAILIQRGALATTLGAARGLRIISAARLERWRTRLVEIDRQLRQLQSTHGPGTRPALALVCAARLCNWSATALVLVSVGVELDVTLLVGVFSVGVLIGWASAVVPFGLGVADGSNYVLYEVLGAAGAAGVFVTLLARARSLSLAMLGLIVMAFAHASSRLEVARRGRLLARLQAEHGHDSPTRRG
jgi:uncharacterized membrane protein YbhN (UPF0104 family)